MSQEAFTANSPHGTGFSVTTLITSSGTATFYAIAGAAIKLSVRSAAVYYQFGKSNSAAITASGTAATQADWIPQNGVIRLSKPQDTDGIWILQDTGAAQIFMTAGFGI